MKLNKIASKARIVVDSPSDRFPLRFDADEAVTASALEPAPEIDCGNESDVQVGSFQLTHLPNIDIERKEHSQSVTTAALLFRHLSIPHNRLILIITFLVICGFSLNDRSTKENNYRQLLDRAELDDINGNYSQAVKSWQSAIEQATKLGDGDKTIADLYSRLAKDLINEQRTTDLNRGNEAAVKALEKAFYLYQKVPYTLPQQAQTKESLLMALPEVLESTKITVNSFNYELMDTAINSLKRNDVDRAIKELKDFINTPNEPLAPGYVSLSTWKTLESSIPEHSDLAEKALPLMLELVYWSSPDFYQEDELKSHYREINSLIDKTIAKTGRDPKDFQAMKYLADQLFRRNEFKSATIVCMRCLGMKFDSKVQETLKNCYVKLHPGSMPAADKRLEVLGDLHLLFAKAFGESSMHVTKTLAERATVYLETGRFAKAEEMLELALARTKSIKVKTKSPRHFITNWENSELAYMELIKLFMVTGQFNKARDLYLQAAGNAGFDKHMFTKFENQYIHLCGKSSQMDNPLLNGITDNRRMAFGSEAAVSEIEN